MTCSATCSSSLSRAALGALLATSIGVTGVPARRRGRRPDIPGRHAARGVRGGGIAGLLQGQSEPGSWSCPCTT